MPRLPLSTLSRSLITRTPLSARAFHRSAPALASEVPQDPFADSKIQALREQLTRNPQALEAVANLVKTMQAKGIDTTKRPTPMQMMKLGIDSEVRAAVQKMMEECQKAGVNLNPEALQALASALGR